eukprot:1056514-Rhodomonas_salina.1
MVAAAGPNSRSKVTMSSGSAKEAWAPDWTVEQYGSGVKGLVFDCDGTLVNSMPMWAGGPAISPRAREDADRC